MRPPRNFPEGFLLALGRDFRFQMRNKSVETHGGKVFTTALTVSNPCCYRLGLHFLIAQNQQEGNLLQAMFPNFIGNFLVTQIGLHPESSGFQAGNHFIDVLGLMLRDVKGNDLDRGAARSGT